MIYLAIPYSNDSPLASFIRDARYRVATKIAGTIMEGGHRVFSPITHNHPIKIANGSVGSTVEDPSASVYLHVDKTVFDVCSDLYVVMIGGWKQSRGVQMEIDWAREAGTPLTFIKPENYGFRPEFPYSDEIWSELINYVPLEGDKE